MILLQIYHWVCQLKNFENQLTFGEVMGKSLASCFFLTHGVYFSFYPINQLKLWRRSRIPVACYRIRGYYFAPGRRGQVLRWPRLSVCLSVCAHISTTTRSILTNLACYLCPWLRPPVQWRRCDASVRPTSSLWMTSYLVCAKRLHSGRPSLSTNQGFR